MGAYRRLDYIPPFPLEDDLLEVGWNGVLRVIISMSDTESCPDLQEDACAHEVPFDGKLVDNLIHHVWQD